MIIIIWLGEQTGFLGWAVKPRKPTIDMKDISDEQSRVSINQTETVDLAGLRPGAAITP